MSYNIRSPYIKNTFIYITYNKINSFTTVQITCIYTHEHIIYILLEIITY